MSHHQHDDGAAMTVAERQVLSGQVLGCYSCVWVRVKAVPAARLPPSGARKPEDAVSLVPLIGLRLLSEAAYKNQESGRQRLSARPGQPRLVSAVLGSPGWCLLSWAVPVGVCCPGQSRLVSAVRGSPGWCLLSWAVSLLLPFTATLRSAPGRRANYRVAQLKNKQALTNF